MSAGSAEALVEEARNTPHLAYGECVYGSPCLRCRLADALALERSRREAAERERDGWMEAAAQQTRNAEFYRSIVHECGDVFGVAARTSDDGSIQDEPLALKVPELVRAAVTALAAARAAYVTLWDAEADEHEAQAAIRSRMRHLVRRGLS